MVINKASDYLKYRRDGLPEKSMPKGWMLCECRAHRVRESTIVGEERTVTGRIVIAARIISMVFASVSIFILGWHLIG